MTPVLLLDAALNLRSLIRRHDAGRAELLEAVATCRVLVEAEYLGTADMTELTRIDARIHDLSRAAQIVEVLLACRSIESSAKARAFDGTACGTDLRDVTRALRAQGRCRPTRDRSR